jgi:2-polyprenyl-3-methyl-5-hydroxy-6-metoxy-1,4-benzoquinol methylase
MSELRPTLRPGYFDALYAAHPDPWNFAASPYERAKYTLTLDVMPKPRSRTALEVGCSIGVLTRLLASRCDSLLAVDAAQAPLVEARRRCADLPNVRFEQMFVPEQWPRGVFDLILLSEVVYYLSREDVGRLATSVTRSLTPGPLDGLDRLSPKWRRGRRSLHRTNRIGLRHQAGRSIC